MKKLHLIILVGLVLAMLGATSAQAGGANKVQVCHVPPGNPTNWHTITIGENALAGHLAHGDLAGTCEENCESLCSDGNPCTQDVDPQAPECACLDDHPPVNCDDSNLCTTDSCDPGAGGCVYAPIDCSDDDLCTVDACVPSTGQCVSTPLACGEGEFCDPGSGECYDPCSGVICEPLDQCHLAGTCFAGTCNDPIAPDGTACDDGDPFTTGDVCTAGTCQGTEVTCPCNGPDFPSFQAIADGTTPVASCVRDEAFCILLFSPDFSVCAGSDVVLAFTDNFFGNGGYAGLPFVDGAPALETPVCQSSESDVVPVTVEEDAVCQALLEAAIAASGVTCATTFCEIAPEGTECDDGDPATTGDVCTAGVCVGQTTYNCTDRNPCTPENTANGLFFFPADDSAQFIQCSQFGDCFVMSCPPGLVWDQDFLTCYFP